MVKLMNPHHFLNYWELIGLRSPDTTPETIAKRAFEAGYRAGQRAKVSTESLNDLEKIVVDGAGVE